MLVQTAVRIEEHLLDAVKDAGVVSGAGSVGEVERLFDAQCQPVVRIILGTSRVLALFDLKNSAGSH